MEIYSASKTLLVLEGEQRPLGCYNLGYSQKVLIEVFLGACFN